MRAKKYILLPRVRRSARNPPKKIGLKRVPKEILNAMAKFRRVSPKIRTNLVGGILAKLLAQRAVNAGLTPRHWRMKQLLQVAGVGHGHQTAEWCVHFPIAVLDRDGESTRV